MVSFTRLVICSLLSALLFVGTVSGEDAIQQDDPSQQRRELWDFMTFLTLLAQQLGPHKPCTRPDGTRDWGPEHGPRWNHCMREAAMEGDSSTSDATTTSSSEYMEYSASSSSEAEDSANTNNITSSGAMKGFQYWMLILAGSVMSAMVAIHMGQRKDPAGGRRHDMSGSVMRRVGAVNAFAAGLFPSTKGKAVEMQASRPEYRLDMSPDGNDTPMLPSATV